MKSYHTKQYKSLFAAILAISMVLAILVPFSASALVIASPNSTPVDGDVGISYSSTVGITVIGLGRYTYTVNPGALGLTASIPTNGSGAEALTITGTPSAAGTASFVVTVTDTSDMTSTTVTVNVNIRALNFVADPLPNATLGTPYSQQASITGASGTYTFSGASSGLTNAGLSISSSGLITGTPTSSGPITFSVTVTDSLSRSQAVNFSLNILGGMSLTTSRFPDAVVNKLYSQAISASGGTTPYTYYHTSGALPPGMIINSAGALSGVPTTVGSYSFVVEVRDSAGSSASGTCYVDVTSQGTSPGSRYPITSGAGQIYSGTGNITYTIAAPIGEFQSVYINGSKISSSYYSVKSVNSGSTQVTLFGGFLNTLKNGTHSLVFNFTNGTANTNLYIGTGVRPPIGGVVPPTKAIITTPSKPTQTKPSEFEITAVTVDEGTCETIIIY